MDRIQNAGIRVFPETRVSGVVPHEVGLQVILDDDRRLAPAPFVVAGLGLRPRVELATQCGLEVEDGIVVDTTFRTSDPNIYAAGDVARFPFPYVGERMRVEHEDHANQSGVMAGRAMAGEGEPYDHLPFFYSEVLGVRYEAVGRTDPGLDTLQVGDSARAVVYYREGGRVKGILLWNLPGKVGQARSVLRTASDAPPEELERRIPLE